jgi:hypothetical protein
MVTEPEPPLVLGGQGRSADSVRSDAASVTLTILAMVGVAGLLIARAVWGAP